MVIFGIALTGFLIANTNINAGCNCCKGNKGGTGNQGGNPGNSKRNKVKTALGNLMNNKEGNRSSLTKRWAVEDGQNGSYIIKFGLFRAIIDEEDINKIKNINDNNELSRIEIVIEMSRPDGNTKYKFNNRSKYLDTLIKSLNVLEPKYKNDTLDDYICVKEINDKIDKECYINLNNGLMYRITNNGKIGRLQSINGKTTQSKHSFSNKPLYLNNVYYDTSNVWNTGLNGNPKEEHGRALLTKAEIENLTLKLKDD